MATEQELESAKQTIVYLHKDIDSLNVRINELWDKLQAAEDGSGMTALKEEALQAAFKHEEESNALKARITELEAELARTPTEPPPALEENPLADDEE